MQLSDMQLRCAERFRDTTNKIVTAAQWTKYLNQAYSDAYSASPFFEFKEVSSVNTLTVTAGTDHVALPTNVTRVLAVRNHTDDIVMSQLDGRRSHFEAFPLGSSQGTPVMYRVFAGSVYVYPTPSGDTKLDVEYVGPPADLAASSDVPVIPAPYHDALIDGALSQAYLDDDNPHMVGTRLVRSVKAELHKAVFDGAVAQMKDELLQPARGDHYPGIVDDWF